jgi:tRNA(Ile2) C34 agmatinyltransferase TiaS
MKETERISSEAPWICGKCGRGLELQKVQVQYLGSLFSMDLPKCPGCGTVLVSEETALGKMAEAEKVLEDK